MARVAVARPASARKHHAAHAGDTVHGIEIVRTAAPQDLATQTEVDVVARVLCAVSMHTTLRESLLSYYASLDPAEARVRSALALERMQKILSHNHPENLHQSGRYIRPWAEDADADGGQGAPGDRSRLSRLALPTLYLIGMMMLAMSVVGSITTIRYLPA